MKTRKDYFDQLPEGVRAAAVRNTTTSCERRDRYRTLEESLSVECAKLHTLLGAFVFAETPEGTDYWNKINGQYFL